MKVNNYDFTCFMILLLDGIAAVPTPPVTGPSSILYVSNITCPNNATSIFGCDGAIAVDESCFTGEREYFVTCFTEISEQ